MVRTRRAPRCVRRPPSRLSSGLGNPQFRLLRPSFEDSCRSLGFEPIFLELSAASEIDGAIARLAQQRVGALVLRDDSFAGAHGPEIIAAALKRGVPTLCSDVDFVREAGALASYTAPTVESYRHAAYDVDRILRGAKPANLPVEQPTQFELVVNLKTAKRLRIAVPESLVLRVDKVIR
jgi:putative ABC transport system substrate-binding protein